MTPRKQIIVVNGKDRTDSIESYQFAGEKCNVVYSNSPRVYSYNRDNVQILKLVRTIDPKTVVFKAKGITISSIDGILDYGEFYRVVRTGRKELSFARNEVQLLKNCLADAKSGGLFEYFKETASAISLVTDNGINILSKQYDKIEAVEDSTVLSRYLNPDLPIEQRKRPEVLIYPFGLNQSQKIAVENAFLSQISIIQGPPGTGKTQTILNIIANAVRNGKTVAVVSNNNSATRNVEEKLEKKGLDFLTAFLGSLPNKARFLDAQTARYPDMSVWSLSREEKQKLDSVVAKLSEELNSMLDAKNRIAEIEQELLAIKPEQFYFSEYYSRKHTGIDAQQVSQLSSEKLMALWLEYEHGFDQKMGFLKRLMIALRFSRAALVLFRHVPEDAIPFIQSLYYENRIQELQNEKKGLEEKLRSYKFEEKMKELSAESMRLFKAELAQRYQWNSPRVRFEKKDFRGNSGAFNREYPVILSTTYSIKGKVGQNLS